MNNIFRGLGVALVTPFTERGEVDFDVLCHLINYVIDGGIDFLCVLGSTAETPCLSEQERRAVKDCAVATAAGRLPILLGMGGNDTRSLTAEIEAFDFEGVDGILSVVPYYNKPSQQGIYEHFRCVAEVAARRGLPVVIYNVPGRTGVNMQAATTLRLAREVDNIVAVKEASGSVAQMETIALNAPEGFGVLSGDDSLACEFIGRGGCGVISVVGNAIPQTFSAMVKAALNGRSAEATSINEELQELYRLAFVDGNPAGIKALLNAKGLCGNRLRLPLTPATDETADGLKIFAHLS
ncbi:MAG: 4-hydroxy-tetrahydrodipicolinate synthase [Bacteroidaceae bacterium]|nr:4-hydroxy-tetrahydrodipicolinate synthase [Bacteroidaceae bacterium]